jgi:DNA-directed RNA polymerase specialized sigma24 family protein
MDLLDPTLAKALQLTDAGVHDEDIAARLDLDPAAIRPVLQVARAKLAALEALEEPAPDDPTT